MDVIFTLQAPWGWDAPECLTGMSVSLDGKVLPMPRDTYADLHPVDLARPPIIGERRGFPEITLYGKPGGHLDLVKWLFLNNSYSERHLMQDHVTTITYHAEPPPAPLTFTGTPAVPDKNGIVAINLDHGKTGVINLKKTSK